MKKYAIIKKLLCAALTSALICSSTGIVNCITYGTGIARAGAVMLKLDRKNVNVKRGKTCKIKYKASGKVKAVSRDKKTATVSVKKKYIVIKGVKKGNTSVKVTCTAKASGKTKKNIKKKIVKIKVKVKKSGSDNKKTVTPTPVPSPTKDPKEVQKTAKELTPFAKGVNSFGIKLSGGLHKDNENLFISPFSIYMALSMLANGASGNTYTELVSTLGIADMTQWNSHIKDYIAGSMDDKVKLNIADSLWLNKKLISAADIDNNFIVPLRDNYNSEVMKDIDFAATDTLQRVNSWIEDKTDGMIKNMLNELKPEIMSLLINTLYFEGEWASKFKEYNTSDDTFHGSSGDNTVKMMKQYNTRYNYFADDRFMGIELNYGNQNAYAMDILLSADKTVSTTELWKSLTDEQKNDVLASFDDAKSTIINEIRLPKFTMEYSTDNMKGELRNMGIKDVFDELRADLTKIGRGPEGPLFVSDVLHKTRLEISETGTKAAAATVILVEAASAMMPPKDKIDFIVDRPFVFTIRDKISGMILFIGEVNNL